MALCRREACNCLIRVFEVFMHLRYIFHLNVLVSDLISVLLEEDIDL